MSATKHNASALLLVFVSLLITLIVAEVSLRLILGDQLRIVKSERTLTYRYDEQLGWFPVEGSSAQFNLTTSINIKHNSRGFRDPEHTPDDRPSVLFLGDSFTWGYDVEAEQRFTDILRDSLPGLNMFNLGISGYGNDQQLLLLREQADFYQPDLVVLIFCADNDRLDNSMNIRYVNYFKPYFRLNEGELELQGQPVPRSSVHWFREHPFLSNSYIVRLGVNAWYQNRNPEKLLMPDPTNQVIKEVSEYSNTIGADFLLGFQKMDVPLAAFLDSVGIEYLNLENELVFSFSGKHWTPEGHSYVAGKLKPYLQRLTN